MLKSSETILNGGHAGGQVTSGGDQLNDVVNPRQNWVVKGRLLGWKTKPQALLVAPIDGIICASR
jgi:hypothetical protein